MIINKALLGKLDPNDQLQALTACIEAEKSGIEYTRYGKKMGVIVSTYATINEAKKDIRNYSVYPRTTRETIQYNRILRSFGITA